MGKRDKLKARFGFSRAGSRNSNPENPSSPRSNPEATSTIALGTVTATSSSNITDTNSGASSSTTVPPFLPSKQLLTPTNTASAVSVPSAINFDGAGGVISVFQTTSPAEPTTTISPLSRGLWAAAFGKLPESDQTAFRLIQPLLNDQLPWSERVDGLIEQTRKKQVECENNFCKFNLLGKEIILRDVAEKVISFLHKFKEVGDIAVQFDPVHAALPWAGVRFLLQAAVGERDQMGDLLVSIEKVTYLTSRCTIFEVLYLSTEDTQVLRNLQESLIKLYTATLQLLSHSYRILNKHTLTRGVYAVFDPNELPGLLSKCDTLESRVEMEAQNCERVRSQESDVNLKRLLESMNAPLLRIDSRVDHLLEKLHEKERLEVLDWASKVLYGKHHDTVSEERTEGTCEWLLSRSSYQGWKDSSSSDILWLHGTAGTGKTYLTSKVIEEIKGTLGRDVNQEGFAFFYCNRNEGDRQDPLSVLRCFVRQLSVLLVKKEFVQKQLRQLYLEGREKSSELTIEICKSLINQFVNQYPRTTLVLDALDECEKHKRDVLIDFFDHLVQNSSRPVKIFISSRPDGDIKERFKNPSNIEIQAQDNQEDISKYIKSEITKHKRWKKMSSRLQDHITETLQAQSQGMFQWAFLQIKQLLDLKQEELIRSKLGKLPKDLTKAYDAIYNRIPDSERKIVNRAFQWVMVAAVPLSTKSLLRAVCQDENENDVCGIGDLDEELLLEYCHNLLVIDPKRKVWVPSHLSVIEYVETHLFSHFQANCIVSSVCLLVLSNTTIYEKRERFEDDEENINPINKYARYYWLTHVQRCEGNWQGNQRLQHLFRNFLGPPDKSNVAYQNWFNIVNHWEKGSYATSIKSRFLLEDLQPISKSIFGLCAFGLFNLVSHWWDNPPSMNSLPLNDRNNSLLCLAAKGGSLPICERLVKWGANVNENLPTKDGSALTAAAAAATAGQWDIVSFLIRSGADVDLQVENGDDGSALVAAVARRNQEIVKLLIDLGAEVNLQVENGTYGSALVAAAVYRNQGIVKLLIDLGAQVNLQVENGAYGSALAAAAAHRYQESVKQLVDYGADVNMQLENGPFGSALCWAAFLGWLEGIGLLVESGADVNLHLKCGKFGSALEAACFISTNKIWTKDRRNKDVALVVKLLIEHGAKESEGFKVDKADFDSRTADYLAAFSKSFW